MDELAQIVLLDDCGDEPTLDRKAGVNNWVERAGGLPCYVNEIARDLHYAGDHSISEAIQIAVGVVRDWCHGQPTGGMKHPPTAKTRAKACAAAAQWEAKKAAAHGAKKLAQEVGRPLIIGVELSEECGVLASDDDADIIIRYEPKSHEGYTILDSEGNILPMVSDKVFFEAAGMPLMDPEKRERVIREVHANHAKYPGTYQKVPKGAIVVSEQEVEAKGILASLNALSRRLESALGLSQDEGDDVVGLAGDDSASHATPEQEVRDLDVEVVPENEVTLAVQTPIVELAPEKVGKFYKKALLPVDREVNYERDGIKKVLSFSRDMLTKFADNLKAAAFPIVPLLGNHPKDSTVRPEDYYGKMVDAEMDDKWFYGIFDLTDRGVKALEDNPDLPTSVGYLENYFRRGDKKLFGPSLQHVALTYMPAVPGVDTRWQSLISMSQEEDARGEEIVVVDLTDEEFSKESSLENEATASNRKEDVGLSDETQAPEVIEEAETSEVEEVSEKEVEMEENNNNVVSLAEFNAVKGILRKQGIKAMLSDEYAKAGVPKVKLDAAFTLLNADEEMVTLSDTGEAALSESDRAGALKELLEGYKGAIEFGEQGTSEDTDADDEAATDRKIRAYAKENELSYRQAMTELAAQGEEVTI